MLQCDFQFQYADLNLQVQLHMQQQLLGIMGPSGCGKSTLLKNITGLLQPSQGSILLNKQVLFDDQKKFVSRCINAVLLWFFKRHGYFHI